MASDSMTLKFCLDTNGTSNIVPNDFIYNLYINTDGLLIGKQLMPFGSFNNYSISDTFSRYFEETNRLGLTYSALFFGILKLNTSVFNNSLGDSLSGTATKVTMTPREGIIFQQSILYDQEKDNQGQTIIKLDVNAMTNIDLKFAKFDTEIYRSILGNNKGSLVLNCGLLLDLNNGYSLSLRADIANSMAESIINKRALYLMGINFPCSPQLNYYIEFSYIVKPAIVAANDSLNLLVKAAFQF